MAGANNLIATLLKLEKAGLITRKEANHAFRKIYERIGKKRWSDYKEKKELGK